MTDRSTYVERLHGALTGRLVHFTDDSEYEAILDALDGGDPHYLDMGEDGWSLSHPLRCRFDGALLSCPVHRRVSDWGPGPADLEGEGRYRVDEGPGLDKEGDPIVHFTLLAEGVEA